MIGEYIEYILLCDGGDGGDGDGVGIERCVDNGILFSLMRI